ncbi:MAG: NAD(P)H-quinone oxidoreductase [Gammaproteobacteria bacterium]|nr:NAD(P)H-quinone oxidoreductase [Gammaproteobacteria bacterium]MBK6582274.1 NAD(P)H-quinone oxidoreductase [Gammaproteobacteria bacterium]MBK7171380.1 NAD(P)H-quinone oxidoreductase [Gammaproteobacteria bacterium]MBK7521453.1 NAD(P)H-quinone oxidoreductase [Gammaproteobacteria bacterium]MBK7729231.1 NAD(P)H-quinone oxidoreductase [Gammaproteobacteria bacterium]
MRQISISEFGGPEVLRVVRGELPQIAAGEVLVRVAAAGVNRPDVVQRLGFYAPPPGVSEVPGLEVAGEIVAIGPAVQRWRVGDEICALVAGGGYAEYVVVPAGQCLPLPRGLSMTEAAALPETAFTVWSNVIERGALARGETLLVHGGSSGIGTMAIQIARARGARVIVTAGSAGKCRACEQLGAELAVNYREQDFVAAVRGFGDGHGADVILDMVGAGYMQRNITAAAVGGRIVQIAFLQGSRIELELMPLMLKRLVLTGSTLRARSVAFKSALASAVEQNVWPLVESARLRPVVHRVFPLAEAAAAHALMESSMHIGKIVLEIAR